MDSVLRCRCGQVQGRVASPSYAGRAMCYCKDCQAYAQFLGRANEILDDAGGSEIVATSPARVCFTQGVDQVRCMSLSPTGPLRWFAGCCRTALGNTPRGPKLAYVGLMRDCLPGSDAELDRAFGPCSITLNTQSARKPVKSTPMGFVKGGLKIAAGLLAARISGRYRVNPFFEAASGKPLREPQVLTLAERQAVTPS